MQVRQARRRQACQNADSRPARGHTAGKLDGRQQACQAGQKGARQAKGPTAGRQGKQRGGLAEQPGQAKPSGGVAYVAM